MVLVQPIAHRGRSAIQAVSRSKSSGRFVFTFQRQQYEFLTAEEAAPLVSCVCTLMCGSCCVLCVVSPSVVV